MTDGSFKSKYQNLFIEIDNDISEGSGPKVFDVSSFSRVSANDFKGYKSQTTSVESLEEKQDIPEVSLWRAVIMQSVLDIVCNATRPENISEKRHSKYWINSGNTNFRTVCEFANLEPDWVSRMIKRAVLNQSSWRRPYDMRNRKMQDGFMDSREL